MQELTERGTRGFVGYGEDQFCTFGTKVSLYESSIIGEPCCWLRLVDDRPTRFSEVFAHLNVDQARILIERLALFVAHAERTP